MVSIGASRIRLSVGPDRSDCDERRTVCSVPLAFFETMAAGREAVDAKVALWNAIACPDQTRPVPRKPQEAAENRREPQGPKENQLLLRWQGSAGQVRAGRVAALA